MLLRVPRLERRRRHVAWLAGASTLLANHRDKWQRTLIAVSNPGEERRKALRR
jgi:metal-dependent amidase/aminoacylase/carboxypeptidase family protein